MNFKKLALTAAIVSVFACGSTMAATETGTLTVNGTLTAACQIENATIELGTSNALFSGSLSGNTNLQVACSVDAAAPKLYAAATRTVTNGTDTFAYNLSLTSGAASNDFPSTASGSTTITQNGALQNVALYAMAPVANFQAKSAGNYTGTVQLTVEY